jgi:hypothetical protein
MARRTNTPADIASRVASRREQDATKELAVRDVARHQTYRLPRHGARQTAKKWFERAYGRSRRGRATFAQIGSPRT